MIERPTPEEIAEYWGGTSLLTVLRQEGYVLVHPDDVPVKPTTRDDYEFSEDFQRDSDFGYRREHQGWNACRAHIFGEGS